MMTSLAEATTVGGPIPTNDENPRATIDITTITPAFLEGAKHKTVCLLHVGFKLLCLIMFVFGSFIFGGFGGDYVFTFVTTVILLSIDFWVVKNISGRLLVGMRWYNEILADNTNQWKYERATDEQTINGTDKVVFWTGVVSWPILWATLSFFYFIQLRFDWMLVTIAGVILGGANLVGFWKCSSESKRKVQEFGSSVLVRAVTSRLGSFFTGY